MLRAVFVAVVAAGGPVEAVAGWSRAALMVVMGVGGQASRGACAGGEIVVAGAGRRRRQPGAGSAWSL